MFDFCDMTFFQCLFYLDTFLRNDIYENISEKTLLYNLVGYFLCSVKLGEKDIYEPTLESFFNISKGIYLSPNKIAHYEEFCLKRINYNIFAYSSYDWITQFISNGIIFNNEINENNEIIHINGHRHSLVNVVNKYSMKLLLRLTIKNCFFKYSPMYIALSIIKLSREKYINKNMIKNKLFHKLIDLYGIDYSSFQECYEELKSELNSETETETNIKEEIKNNEENHKSVTLINEPKRYSVDKIPKSLKSIIKKKNNNILTECTSSKQVTNYTNVHDEITENSNKKNINGNSNEIHKRNKGLLTNVNHLSIDCKKSSKDSLPKINLKQKIKKEAVNISVINDNYFISNEKDMKNNIKKEAYNDTELKIKKSRKKKKYLTTNKLIRVHFDQSTENKNNHNQLEQIKESIHVNKNKKYILKSDKNLFFNDLSTFAEKEFS